jgi:very-short-patch-repair endonuclease
MSDAEDELMLQMRAAKLPTPIRECRISEERRWRCDFVWPTLGLIVEVEGGVFSGGRHTRGLGFTKDCEKYNFATLAGYSVLRVTPEHIKTGIALEWVEKAIKLLSDNG